MALADLPIVEQIRILNQYCESGIITQRELIQKVTTFAIDKSFFKHLDLLPGAAVLHMREVAQRAPAHPEDCCFAFSWCASSDADWEAHDRSLRETHYWAAKHLREYFYPNLPPVPFEPIKLAGVIHEAIKREGTIVVFGVEESWLIRNNPIRLIRPDGTSTNTYVSSQEHILRPCDAQSASPETKRFGQSGLFLGTNVKAVSDVPVGTEVWVDRSGLAELRCPQKA